MTLYSSKVSGCFSGSLIPTTPPLRWHLQPWTHAHVRSECSLGRHSAVRPPQCWREPGIVPRPPAGEWEGGGGGTDGSSSCRSEHKAPERSLQSVFPVLIIDKSEGTGPAGGVRPAPACQTFPFFPFPPPSALNRLISRLFPAFNPSSHLTSRALVPVQLHTSVRLLCLWLNRTCLFLQTSQVQSGPFYAKSLAKE